MFGGGEAISIRRQDFLAVCVGDLRGAHSTLAAQSGGADLKRPRCRKAGGFAPKRCEPKSIDLPSLSDSA